MFFEAPKYQLVCCLLCAVLCQLFHSGSAEHIISTCCVTTEAPYSYSMVRLFGKFPKDICVVRPLGAVNIQRFADVVRVKDSCGEYFCFNARVYIVHTDFPTLQRSVVDVPFEWAPTSSRNSTHSPDPGLKDLDVVGLLGRRGNADLCRVHSGSNN